MIGVSVSPSVNPFEDISHLASTYDSTSSLCIIDGLTGNLRENFVNGINDKKNSEWQVSDDEGDAYFERNAVDIIRDDE